MAARLDADSREERLIEAVEKAQHLLEAGDVAQSPVVGSSFPLVGDEDPCSGGENGVALLGAVKDRLVSRQDDPAPLPSGPNPVGIVILFGGEVVLMDFYASPRRLKGRAEFQGAEGPIEQECCGLKPPGKR